MNASIMTLTAIVLRIIGVNFSVYISNRIGEEGMGLYQLILSVYRLGITLASSGIGFASTRIIAEELENKNEQYAKKAASRCLVISLSFGLLASGILLLFAEDIGRGLLGDERTILSLRFLSVSLPFIVMSSVMGGYFTAVRRVAKNASALLLEQLIRIEITVSLLSYFMSDSIEYACLAIVLGGVLSEVIAFIYTYTLYVLDRRKLKTGSAKTEKLNRRIFRIAVPVAISSYIRSSLLTIEHLMIPSGLKKYGMGSSGALSVYGVITGMVMPIILFPSAFLYAFSDLLIPEFAAYNVAGKKGKINRLANKVMQLTCLFSVGVSGILFIFSDELGQVLYGSAAAGHFIKVLAPLVTVMFFDHLIDAILKGLNEQVSVVKYNIVDSVISVALVWALIPVCGIKGYLFVVYFGEVLNAIMSAVRLMRMTEFRIKFFSWFFKPILSVALAYGIIRFLFFYADIHIAQMGFEIFSAILIAALLYLVILRIFGCISQNDYRLIKSLFVKQEKA